MSHRHFDNDQVGRYFGYFMSLLFLTFIFLGSLFNDSTIRLAWGDLGAPIPLEGSGRLRHLFDALDQRGQGKGIVRLSHIGDSHIIADFWTGEMRDRLQKRFGDGGRGFVLGGEMWRSYGQRHVWHYTEGEWVVSNLKRGKDTGVFGPGGAALICEKLSCTTGIETREGQRSSRFDILEVFTLGHSQGGNYQLKVDGRINETFSTFSPWLNVLKHRVLLPLSHHKVSVSPGGKQGELWLFGFSLKNSQGGLIYDSIGLNGSQAKHLLKNGNKVLKQAFRHLESQVLILSFGINEIFDRGYERNKYAFELEYLLKVLRDPDDILTQKTDCILTGPFAALRRGSTPSELEEVYQIQRSLSEKYHCAFWDAQQAMGGSIRPWQKLKFARKDGVHLSRKGYKRIAKLFEDSLMLSFMEWKEERLQKSKQSSLIPQPK